MKSMSESALTPLDRQQEGRLSEKVDWQDKFTQKMEPPCPGTTTPNGLHGEQAHLQFPPLTPDMLLGVLTLRALPATRLPASAWLYCGRLPRRSCRGCRVVELPLCAWTTFPSRRGRGGAGCCPRVAPLAGGGVKSRAMRLSALLAMAAKVTLPPNYRYGMSRPGSLADKRRNPPGTRRRRVAVEPISDEDWNLFCGDRVEILEGKDAGKQGKVVQIIRQRNWVVVEGLNTHYRYVGKAPDTRGTMVPSEAPLLYRQVKLVDPVDRKPTEVQWKFTEAGERVRVSARSGRIIPKPEFPRSDGIIPETWTDGPKDTSVEDALERTYVPSLKTLEEEVMETMGIQEHRRHKKVYWY